MRPIFTKGFVRQYQRLPRHLQHQFDKAFEFLLVDLRHPSLQAKKMEGQQDAESRDIGEARVSQAYRFTFAIERDTYVLYRMGFHDIDRRPY